MTRMRQVWIRTVSSVCAIVALGGGLLAAAETERSRTPSESGAEASAAVNPSWWDRVRGRTERAEYDPSRSGRGLQAPNRANGMRTYFRDGGIEVVSREATDAAALTWRTLRWGRRDALAPLENQRPHPREIDGRVVYRHAGFDEWYENGPSGLEQGFTIRRRPEGDGPMVLVGEIGGNLNLRWRPQDGMAVFSNDAGREVLRYGDLHVTDADGCDLWSELKVEGREVAIVVDDHGAEYPLTIDPILDSPAWSAEADQAGARFGMEVATAGDVNGDGYSDVLVSAPYFDAGEDDEGRVFVYLGSPNGLADTPAWTAELNQPGAQFGLELGTAGDVNADGFSDILVGTWLYSHGQTSEGGVFLYLGSPSGPGASPAWMVEGDRDGAAFGISVATAGDVNADGYSDVIFGALHVGGSSDSGYALVYHGSSSGLGAAPVWIQHVSTPGAGAFGWSVSTAGDVNGDGFADVIIGSSAGGSPDGAAYVYHGSPSGLFSVYAWRVLPPHDQENYGCSVATAGDVNGDGFADVIVGAEQWDNGEVDEGRAFVYYGSGDGLSTSPSWWADGEQTDARFGTSVSPAGDVNGDGYADILIGAPRFDGGQLDEGRAVLYLGSHSGLSSAVWSTEGNQPAALLGASVATAGDVNGDGFSDLIVGASGYGNGQSGEGRALVFHGGPADLSTDASWIGEPDQNGAGFGTAVASADVNGDGYSDVFVAALGFDDGQTDEGGIFGYYGSYLGLPFSARWLTESNQAGASMGWRKGVASAGDVNGDGYDDLIAGAPLYDNGQDNEGRVWVFQGSAVGLTFPAAWSAESDQVNALFGICVASAGDVNGDGYADVIVGTDPSAVDPNGVGRAVVYLGSPGGLGSSPAWSAVADQPGSGFAASVASAGDVNGDGFSDVIIGAPLYDHGSTDEGRVFVYLGGPGGLASGPAWSAESNQALALFGSSTASAGDVNGDGFSDVIVGAGQFDAGELDEGRAFVYYGSPAGLSASADWTTESNQESAGFQIAVAGAGDLNADGYSDVLVGFETYDNGEIDEGIARVFLGSASGLGAEASWQVESNQTMAALGHAIASAGDVNGDGFGDVIVGAVNFDSFQTNEGRAFLYYGNGSGGLERAPMQARADDSARIAALGVSDSQSAFRLRALARTPAGRGRVKLQFEVKPLGALLDGSGLASGPGTDTGFPSGAGSMVPMSEPASGLFPGTLYHWRARIVSESPFFPHSPWFTLPDNAANEGDIRTGGQPTSVEGTGRDGRQAPAARLLAPGRNPFHDNLPIAYTLPERGRVRLTVHDVLGRQVALLRDEAQERGRQSASWNGRDGAGAGLPSGIYYVRLESGGRVETQKVVFAH